jgi:hypothetical protein
MIIRKKLTYQDRLFSDYLDELEERAFCEGYEYAQREFGADPLLAKQIEKIANTVKYGELRRSYKNLPKYLRNETRPKVLVRNMKNPSKEDLVDLELLRLTK